MIENFVYRYKKEKILYNVALIYPNKYKIGISSLGFQWVYHLLQSTPWIYCERAFLNDGRIKTVENSIPIEDFDIIFFSISFENDILNIISILLNANIKLYSKDREKPLVCIGGIATTIIPQYLKEIADIIFCGDAELTLLPFLEVLKKTREKDKIIELATKIKGIYSDNLSSTYLPYYSSNDEIIPHSVIISDEAEFKNTALILVSKGCLYRCKFCFVSNIYENYQPLPAEKILQTALIYKNFTDRIGLIAATLTNHPDFKFIVTELNKAGFMVSFSAFRVETLDEEFLKTIVENENKTLVIAPETSSQKLKKLIGKFISDEVIFEKIRIACEAGIKRLKLYFMIGLPEEEKEDIDQIISFIAKVREISIYHSRKFGYIPEIIVDINPFVPKPFTPLFESEMEDINSLRKKLIYIKNKVRKYGRIYVYGESPKSSYLQYLLAKNKISFDELLSFRDS
jgi:radical SAM superfamily enzyme YgiQ (UPF0313 family)